jgi:hypothetical protein
LNEEASQLGRFVRHFARAHLLHERIEAFIIRDAGFSDQIQEFFTRSGHRHGIPLSCAVAWRQTAREPADEHKYMSLARGFPGFFAEICTFRVGA